MTRSRLLATTAGSTILALALLPGVAAAAGGMSVEFDTPGQHDFKVPDGVEVLLVEAVGEQGGAGARSDGNEHPGGFGGLVRARVRVRPGASYWVDVDTGGGPGGRGRWPGGAGGGGSVLPGGGLPTPGPGGGKPGPAPTR